MIRRALRSIEFYPAGLGLGFFCLGVVGSRLIQPRALLWALPLWVATLAYIPAVWRSGPKTLQWVCLGALLFFTGINFTLKANLDWEDFAPPPGMRIIHATVKDQLASGPGFRRLLVGSGWDVESRRNLPGFGRVFLRMNNTALCAGDRIAFRAIVRKPRNWNNPGEFDWELHCKNRGIMWLTSVDGEDSLLMVRRGWGYHPRSLLFKLREAMNRFIEEQLSGDVRAVTKGLVLGDRGEISHALRRSFADSGLAHMLSASGLHVGIVALMVIPLAAGLSHWLPAILLRIPFRKLAAAVSLPAMVAYCLLVGARIPAMRATIMGLVVVAALLLDRRWHSLNSLGLAGLIIVLIRPFAPLTLGFQLSFLAVLGILVAVPSLLDKLYADVSTREEETEPLPEGDTLARVRRKFQRMYPTLVGLLFTPMAAQAAVAPVVMLTFRSLPTYSLPANLATGLMLTLALPLAVAGSLVGTVVPAIGSWLLQPASVMISAIIDIARMYADLPGNTLSGGPMGPAELVSIVFACACFLWFLRSPSQRSAAGLSVACVLAALIFMGGAWIQRHDALLRVTFLNVGRADAALIRPPAGPALLVDGGSRTDYYDAGQSVLIPFLHREGIRSLGGAVITHPQMDHMGGLLVVLERFSSDRLWLNQIPVRSPFRDRILSVARARGAQVLPADRDQPTVGLGTVKLHFLNPRGAISGSPISSKEVNNSSVIFRLDHGEVSFLFTGDLEREGEEELVRSGVSLRSTVLKVAHHGCGTSSTMRFLRAVQPRVAIISCTDRRNDPCPADAVLARLGALGTRIFWTGRDGAVIMESDRKALRVKAGSGQWETVSVVEHPGRRAEKTSRATQKQIEE